MDKHTAYFNILDALPRDGCVLCRLAHDVEVRFIKDVLYSKTTAVEMRGELREARGFCMAHAMQLGEIGHALDLSIIYQDVLMTLQQALESPSRRQATSRRGKSNLSETLGPQGPCPACAHRAELTDVYVETFLDHLVDPEFIAKVRATAPLCLSHYRQAIEKGSTADVFETLREIQVAHWEHLIIELGEFVRKHDHRFRHEPVGTEGTAWIRAIDAIVGTRSW